MKSKDLSNLLIGQDRKTRNGGTGIPAPEEPVTKSASLLDDTLTDKKRKTNWKTPIWVSSLVIAAGLLTAYFTGAENPGDTALSAQTEAARNPQLLEKLVDEAKEMETEAGPSGNPVTAKTQPAPIAIPQAQVPKPAAPAPEIRKPAPAAAPKAATSPPSAEETPRPANMPQLIRDVPKEEPALETTDPADAKPAPAGKQEDSFAFLRKNSKVAEKLISGGYSNLVYSGWKVIRETDQEIWIDVEAVWSTGGPSIHHIWSVDVKNGSSKPLSQAARNLEALNG